jgi:hypothetical protein
MNMKKKLQEEEKRDACQKCMMFVNACQTPPPCLALYLDPIVKKIKN